MLSKVLFFLSFLVQRVVICYGLKSATITTTTTTASTTTTTTTASALAVFWQSSP